VYDLVDLDGRVDLGDKPEAREEANRTSEQHNTTGHDQHVTKVQDGTRRLSYIQFTIKKVNSV